MCVSNPNPNIAPPITGVNTGQILDQLVTPTHIDNCKLGLGRFLRTHLIAFDNCVNGIISKLSRCVDTYSGVRMTAEQTDILRKALTLQLFEVPNTLSYNNPVGAAVAARSFGANSTSFSFSGSGGFGATHSVGAGMGRADPNQMECDCNQAYQNINSGATVSPVGVGQNTAAAPTGLGFGVAAAPAVATAAPVMLNVKDVINKICKPVFTMVSHCTAVVGTY